MWPLEGTKSSDEKLDGTYAQTSVTKSYVLFWLKMKENVAADLFEN